MMIFILIFVLLLLPEAASGQNPTGPRVDIVPSGTSAGNTGELWFWELLANGTHVTGFKAPDSLAASIIYTLPTVDGSSGHVLTTDGAGVLSWTAGGGGGSGCVVTGAAGEVQFSDGAGACLDDAALTWDNTNKRLGIGTAAPSVALDLVAGVANAATFRLADVGTDATQKNVRIMSRHYTNSEEDFMLIGAAVNASVAEVRFGGGFGLQNAATEVSFWTAANPTTLAGTRRMFIDTAIRVETSIIPNADNTYDLGADGSFGAQRFYRFGHIKDVLANRLRVGINGVTSFTDYHRWEVGASLNVSVLENNSGDPFLTYDSSLSPQRLTVNGRIAFTGSNTAGTPRTILTRALGGSEYTLTMPNVGPLANNRMLEFDASGNATWINTPSGGGSFTCNTANNCVDISGTQTITGVKTFQNVMVSRTIQPQSDSVYDLGTNGSFGSERFFRLAHIDDVLTGRVRVGFVGVSGYTDTHRWEHGAGLNISVIENSGGVAILTLDSSVSPQSVRVGGNLVVDSGLSTGAAANSTVYIGTSGNFYNRTLAGASTGVSCGGVANGWTAVSTDNYVVVCRSGTRYRAQLVAF